MIGSVVIAIIHLTSSIKHHPSYIFHHTSSIIHHPSALFLLTSSFFLAIIHMVSGGYYQVIFQFNIQRNHSSSFTISAGVTTIGDLGKCLVFPVTR